MVDLLIVGVVVAVPVLYAADRILKARAQALRLRTMSDRLTAATARADEQQEQHHAAAQASAALTSVMPAIKRPPLSLPDQPPPGAAPHGEPSSGEPPHGPAHGEPSYGPPRPRTGCGHAWHQDHAHPRRPSRTGEHALRSTDRARRS